MTQGSLKENSKSQCTPPFPRGERKKIQRACRKYSENTPINHHSPTHTQRKRVCY